MMLADGEIHLWSSSITKAIAYQDDFYRTLSQDERDKAERFRFDEHRNRYIVARGLLRSILSRYVGIGPERLQFAYEPKGKPTLLPSHIHFNAAHSNDVAVVALATEAKVGVDIEYVRSIPDSETIAKMSFSRAEYHELLKLTGNQRRDGFFNCWTRKEAYLKAIGDGLYAPLDQFQVTLRPEQPATFVTIQGDQTLASKWSLFDWKPSTQYAGAVAIYGRGWHYEEKSIALIGL